MRTPAPIPRRLFGASFPTSAAPVLGISTSRLRRAGVEHPFFGVVSVSADLDSVAGRCRAYLARMAPGQVFTHCTALELFGAPLPRGAGESLHVSVLFPRTPPRAYGVHGHSLRRLDSIIRDGMLVADPASAWCQASLDLSLRDLVAVGDFLVTPPYREEQSLISPSELFAAATAVSRGRGALRRADALSRIRVGPLSRTESLLRLALVDAGLPEPGVALGVDVGGGVVLHVDLGYRDAKIAIEYEGDFHRVDRETWLRDLARREMLEDAGWRVIRVTSADLWRDIRPLVARIERLLATRGSR